MKFYRRKDCRFCGSLSVKSYLDLGEQPPSNSFLPPDKIASEEKFPLEVFLCESCGLSQLLGVVQGEDIFDEYQYLSSSSRALIEHYRSLTKYLTERLGLQASDRVLDIGCNDGIMLDAYPESFRKIGIEPSKVFERAKEKGHVVFNEFFTENLAKKILSQEGKVQVITATNVFAHIDGIHTVVRGVRALLHEKGCFVIETPYVLDMIEDKYFDTIYHEHLCYLGLTPLVRLMDKHGLTVFDVEHVSVGASGPAIRVFVGHPKYSVRTASVYQMIEKEREWGILRWDRYQQFSQDVERIQSELRDLLRKLRSEGAEIGAYGAPAKGNTLLNTFHLDRDWITAGVAETNTVKQGKLTPGSHLPIISEEDFLKRKPQYALLLTWNYLDFFLQKSEFIKGGGKFIVPFPKPRICPR